MINYFRKYKIKSLKNKLHYLADTRINSRASETDLEKEVALHYKLAKLYEKLKFNKAFPDAAFLEAECYRNAATLEDANALYLFAKALIERGRFWQQLSSEIFQCNAHKKHARDNFDEAFVYLQAAIDQGHALAKRLYGLAYINGWGLEADEKRGFELVIASIEEEGAWDKATQIFDELGLNRPEFFAYMSSRKQN